MELEILVGGGLIGFPGKLRHPFSTVSLLTLDDGRKGLIDTGNTIQLEALDAEFERRNLDISSIEFIILTHVHLDHIINSIYFPNAEIYVHEAYASKNYSNFGKIVGIAYEKVIKSWKVVKTVKDGDRLFGKIEVIHTPYHAREHISLVLDTENMGRVGVLGDICYTKIAFYDILKGYRTDRVAEIVKGIANRCDWIILAHDEPIKISDLHLGAGNSKRCAGSSTSS